LDMHTIHARFTTQEEAESVVRKLSSLRGDRFRLERETGGYTRMATPETASGQTLDAMIPSEPAGSPVENYSGVASTEFASDAGSVPAAAFTLSANIPPESSEQARKVILDAGGQMM
jgi:hypothetical protein